MEITSRLFGTTADGREVHLYHMQNHTGAYVDLLDWGAHIQAIGMPDRDGNIVDVCLGFDDMEGYEKYAATYMGATIGRNANRLKDSSFKLNNIVYQLSSNEGKNQLHGGVHGFDSYVWNCVMQEHLISFYRNSEHMEEGYPGLMRITVNFELTSTNELRITYTAMSEQDTLVNLTNHAYFNLAGAGAESIGDHILQLNARRITPVDEELIPTGELLAVENTPYDLTVPTRLGDALAGDHPMMESANGFDINYVLDEGEQPAAVLVCPQNGIRMTCTTDMPCVQVYTANYTAVEGGKGDASYGTHSAICLETQRYPNAINCPSFPSAVLRAKEIFRTKTVYAFDVVGSQE